MSHLEIPTGLFVLFLVYTSRFQSLKGLFHQIFLHMSTPLFLAGSFHNFFPHMSHILIFSYRFIYSHAVLLCQNAGNPSAVCWSLPVKLPSPVPDFSFFLLWKVLKNALLIQLPTPYISLYNFSQQGNKLSLCPVNNQHVSF